VREGSQVLWEYDSNHISGHHISSSNSTV
jgi:hypothetical protein